MGIFRRKKGSGAAPPSLDESNPTADAHFKERFGLTFQGGNVGFDGRMEQQYASVLTDPQLCLAVLKKLKGSIGFDQICILPSSPPMIVCGTSPPMAIATSLSTEATASLMTAISKESGKQVVQYQGVWLLHVKG